MVIDVIFYRKLLNYQKENASYGNDKTTGDLFDGGFPCSQMQSMTYGRCQLNPV